MKPRNISINIDNFLCFAVADTTLVLAIDSSLLAMHRLFVGWIRKNRV